MGERQRKQTRGSSELPSREVQPSSTKSPDQPEIDHSMSTESELSICVLTEDGDLPSEPLRALIEEIPVDFLENEAAIFT